MRNPGRGEKSLSQQSAAGFQEKPCEPITLCGALIVVINVQEAALGSC